MLMSNSSLPSRHFPVVVGSARFKKDAAASPSVTRCADRSVTSTEAMTINFNKLKLTTMAIKQRLICIRLYALGRFSETAFATWADIYVELLEFSGVILYRIHVVDSIVRPRRAAWLPVRFDAEKFDMFTSVRLYAVSKPTRSTPRYKSPCVETYCLLYVSLHWLVMFQ